MSARPVVPDEPVQGGTAMRTQTAVGVLILLLAIVVAAGLQLTRAAG